MSKVHTIPTPHDPSMNRNRVQKKEDDPKKAFMNVFLAQMKMQDPTKPFDSSTMMQQMSQLTSLQATDDLGKAVKTLNANMIHSQAVEATNLIGRKVHIIAGVSSLTKEDGISGSVLVPKPGASDVTITIKDQKGNVVKTIKEGKMGDGLLDFKWDGIGPEPDNKVYEPGFYKISASATIQGKQYALDTCGSFKINSVSIDPTKGAILNVDGLGGRDLKDIIKIV